MESDNRNIKMICDVWRGYLGKTAMTPWNNLPISIRWWSTLDIFTKKWFVCVCVRTESAGGKVVSQMVRCRGYTIQTIHRGSESRVTTIRYMLCYITRLDQTIVPDCRTCRSAHGARV